jgi:hypothetical protein
VTEQEAITDEPEARELASDLDVCIRDNGEWPGRVRLTLLTDWRGSPTERVSLIG